MKKACAGIHIHTSSGPDEIAGIYLREGADELSKAFQKLFNLSLSWGIQPQEWRDGIISPIFKKKGEPYHAINFRPICLTSIVIRMFERLLLPLLHSSITHDGISSIHLEQAGFRSKHACMDHLYKITHHIGQTFRKQSHMPVVFIDISKAYDTVWIPGLLFKCFNMGIKGNLWLWLYNFLHHRRIG